jgi:hypothetical protein
VKATFKKVVTFIMKKDSEKLKRGGISIKARLDQVLRPLESKLKSLVGEMLKSDAIRAKMIKSLQKKGSLARLLVKDADSLLSHLQNLQHPNGGHAINNREVHFYYDSIIARAYALIAESLGVLGVIIFVIVIFPFALVLDIVQLVLATIIMVSCVYMHMFLLIIFFGGVL